MATKVTESSFLASAEKGTVSSILMRPAKSQWMVVLGHGASTHLRHATVAQIADRLAEFNIATFRYNFPYAESGGGRNSNAVCIETVRAAIVAAHQAANDLEIVAGGHSFSGRMTSSAAAESPLPHVRGLVFFAFPLHPAGRPSTERADHLQQVPLPMLFLTGTRDELAEIELLRPVCQKLGPRATVHLLDTADHSFKVLKRSRKTDEDVFLEMGRAITEWLATLERKGVIQ